jgi:hypothetical protein
MEPWLPGIRSVAPNVDQTLLGDHECLVLRVTQPACHLVRLEVRTSFGRT